VDGSLETNLQVVAYPEYYDTRKKGCEIPKTGFHGHGPPTQVDTIRFSIKDAAGAAVTSWQLSGLYMVTISAYSTAPVNAWVHASEGAYSCMTVLLTLLVGTHVATAEKGLRAWMSKDARQLLDVTVAPQ
jgi:hypothetical protein